MRAVGDLKARSLLALGAHGIRPFFNFVDIAQQGRISVRSLVLWMESVFEKR